MNEAPVLLIVFNRPDTTKKVLNALRIAAPRKLYIFSDAPRNKVQDDLLKNNEVREIIKDIDWDCDVKYNFAENNLGCGWGPANAINWAFEHEDRLIVLEDDCVPSFPFFKYCNYLLEKYLNDTRIWLVSGRNDNTDPKFFEEADYFFSHYGHSWGWATWKRVWNKFDMSMKNYPAFRKQGGALNHFFSKKEGKLYNRLYDRLYRDPNLSSHVWDFQFGFTIISNGGLCIIPRENLIENIGLYGTHSKGINKFCNLKASEKYEIINEPEFVLANRNFDQFHFRKHISKTLRQKTIIEKAIRKTSKYFRRGNG